MTEKRLSKALAHAGIASRRACEELIFEGRVTVNAKVITLPQTLVNWSNDLITVDGAPIQGEEKKVYYILNKPKGYLCSSIRKHPREKLVIDLFHGTHSRLFTVGRLDKETSGLLIVTNDGHFANNVIHPSLGVEKEYLAKTKQEISPEHLAKISKGIMIEGTFVKPAAVKKVRRGTVKVTVMEGKKREVRELLRHAGLDIVTLSRIRIGGLVLGPLGIKEWRPLTPVDRAQISGKG